MIRTQVQFTAEQMRRLRAMARRRHVSVSELVRESVTALLDSSAPDRAELYDRAERAIGRFRDAAGATDVAAEHDRYLADADA